MQEKTNIRIPIALVVAAIVLSGALLFSYFKNNKGKDTAKNEKEMLLGINTLLEGDHFLGNPKADIILIEYSDYDCRFCAGYFSNMSKVVEELGKSGKLLWIHRHLPFTQIHPYSKDKAIFAECAGAVGGEEKFWEASKKLYEATISDKNLTSNDLRILTGLDEQKFNACVTSDAPREKVEREYNEAYNAGIRGTPFTVIIKGNERYGVAESLPYFDLRTLVESLLNE